MEDLAQEIITGVVVGVIVNVITPNVISEWEQGWERDCEAGGVSYREADEGTVKDTVEVLNEKAIRQLLTRSSLAWG
jgi:hypothetical protein